MSDSSENPLLHLKTGMPFDRIRGEHVEPAVHALLDEAKVRLRALETSQGPRTFANTMTALEKVTEDLELALGVISHLESVATTPELRDGYNAVQAPVSEFFTSITLSEGVWRALREFAETDEARALSGTRRRFLDKTLADFRRSGAELDPEGKKRLAQINVELAVLTLKYSQNVLDSTNAFEIVIEDRDKLAGLPEGAIEAARASAAEKGLSGYRFTLQAPSYNAIVTYLDDRAVREKMYRANVSRATEGERDNRPIVRKILELRREKAKLLKFASFADLVLEDRMAKTGEAARKFIATLRERALPQFKRENAELEAFSREIAGPSAPPLAPWDVPYYAEKLRRARYDFDDESLRPYFPADPVLSGVFTIASRLYGVRIEPWAGVSVWHPSVKAYRIVEGDGRTSALFYADMWPRETKRDGAWMQGLVTHVPSSETKHDDALGGIHIAVLAGNFMPPVGDKPALLNHREVETVFHEFGHMMHHASSCVEIRTLAATNVAWDFVELPSQIMENWCWEKEALDLFARHYQTGEPIPDALFERMRAARTFRAANAMIRQLGFAEADLALHIDWDPAKDGDPVLYGRSIFEQYSPLPLPPEHAMLASFSHLFSSPVGYAAGYYSYKWAEVLDADAFSRFKREGIFSREVGEAFRSHILAKGDSADPMALYVGFMGRQPTLEALLQRDDLVAEAVEAEAAVAS
ncbi:MAG: M3 family metallopeptidase [Polyangiaceae bacterium]|nr:M3 family metallopeptidase [Polyangiaceae bacterium]